MPFPAKKTAAAGKTSPAPKKVYTKAELAEKAKIKAAKEKLITFKAPSDFKPCSIALRFITQHDGMIHPQVTCERIRGLWSNPEAKRYNMAEYDPVTLTGIVSRLSASCYSSNVTKRLPPKTKFLLIIRTGVKAANGSLTVRIQAAGHYVEVNDKLKLKWYEDKKDPAYAKLRRSARLLRGAFVNVQLPPAGRRPKKEDDAE